MQYKDEQRKWSHAGESGVTISDPQVRKQSQQMCEFDKSARTLSLGRQSTISTGHKLRENPQTKKKFKERPSERNF